MNPAQILIAEDDGVVATHLSQVLQDMGYRIAAMVATGEDAVTQAGHLRPDLALMDIRLRGGMNGIEAAREIHRELDIPVVYLTAYADEELVGRAKTTEPYAYLTKPVRDQELKASLEIALYKSAAERRIKHLNDVLRAVRDVNQLITREQDRQRLLDQACQILVRTRGYRLACILGANASGEFQAVMARAGGASDLLDLMSSMSTEAEWLQSPGCRAFTERQPVMVENLMTETPAGPRREAALARGVASEAALPMLHAGRLHGVLGVAADRPAAFDVEEMALLSELAGDLALALHSLEAQAQRQQAEESLRRLEWMLSKGGQEGASPPFSASLHPAYPDLSQLNTCRTILDAVGEPLLNDIVGDYLDLLDTSAAVFERNGDYALGLVSSGWCRLLAAASLRLCGTADNRQALTSGLWHCHESCWTDASRRSIETGDLVDRECAGGIHLFAAPIRAGRDIIGSVNFGYGDPPRDPARLRELAAKYGVDLEELTRQAQAYESRPAFIIELAKRRLAVSARLIGEIVDRKRAEVEKEGLQSQLLQAQKMESVGRLAGGVAHDFNNMLQAILGNVALAFDQLPADSPLQEDLREIRKAAERSADLTRQLLAFARRQTIQPKILDLNETVAGLMKMLSRLIGEDIDLLLTPGANLWPVELDPSQMDQILANLCVNARDAIAGTGKVTIETQNVVLDGTYARTHADCVAGEYVMLAVSDDGRGMDPDTQQHLFEPFFTTKDVGQGTGLGLATVYGIVRQNQGLIDVESEPGRGTTFRIYLPRSAAELPAPVLQSAARPVRGTETVLLVEDEGQILHLGRRILEQHGYTVLATSSPKAALALAAQYSGPLHLLITDVVMPGMNGKELRLRLLDRHPDVKCLFMSGYTANVIAHHGVLDPGVHFLQKPFTLQSLAEKVREVLEETSDPEP